MKSLMKNFINPNWCCQDNRIKKNRSEKQLAFDIRSKSFSIVNIKDIRKGYKEKMALEKEQTLKQKGGQWIQINGGDKIVDRRKSLLAVHCRKANNQKQSQNHVQSMDDIQIQKLEIKKQKIRLTCAKNDAAQLIREPHERISQSYLKIDKAKRALPQHDTRIEHKFSKEKRFSFCIQPIKNLSKQQKLSKNLFETNSFTSSFTPSNIVHKQFFSTPSESISKKNHLNNFLPKTKQESICTTIQNSQNYSVNTVVDQSVESHIVERKRQQCEIDQDKENDISLGNMRIELNQAKKYRKRMRDHEERIAQSIFIEQNEESYRERNHYMTDSNHYNIDNLAHRISHLYDQYNQLKLQESSLLLKLNSDHHQFHQKYQILFEKKLSCEINQKLRRQEINQIKRLLYQRFNS